MSPDYDATVVPQQCGWSGPRQFLHRRDDREIEWSTGYRCGRPERLCHLGLSCATIAGLAFKRFHGMGQCWHYHREAFPHRFGTSR